MNDERRWRMLIVPDGMMLQVFQQVPLIGGFQEGDLVIRWKLTEPVPASATIARVSYDLMSQGFVLIIEDKSFDIVLEGDEIPTWRDHGSSIDRQVFRCVDAERNLYELLP